MSEGNTLGRHDPEGRRYSAEGLPIGPLLAAVGGGGGARGEQGGAGEQRGGEGEGERRGRQGNFRAGT